MIFRRRIILVLLLCAAMLIFIVVLRSLQVKSSSHLGRLVFTDYVKPEHRYTIDVFDLEGGTLSSLHQEPYQDIGFLSVIDAQYAYASMCFARNNPLFCSALVSTIVAPKDVQRFATIKPFWKDTYGAPVWSPDGAYVAFNVMDAGTQNASLFTGDTVVMKADGTNIVDLTPKENINGFDFSWSPDSQQIAFACGNAQYLCMNKVDGSYLQKLKTLNNNNLRDVAWSPNGNQIVFTLIEANSNRSGIFLINANGRLMHRLVGAGSDEFDYSSPVWSPDGSKIAFQLRELQDNNSDIYVIKADGTDLHSLSQGLNGNNFGAVWSPDSLNVAFFSWQQQSGAFLYVADASRGNPHKITDNSTFDLLDVGTPELYWIR